MLFVSIGVTFVAGLAYTVGWQYRRLAPVFAVGWLALASYRGSWGQLLHFENLFVLHLLIVGLAPAADRWSLDRAGRAPKRMSGADELRVADRALAAMIVVITYVITGVAKLRYGGLDWIFGDTLRNHVAYAAARLDVLGADPSPLAAMGVDLSWVWPFAAAATIVIELSAPIALFGGKVRTAWVVAAWLLHAGVLAFMLIGFPYPLFLVAFAPFFRIERLWTDRPAVDASGEASRAGLNQGLRKRSTPRLGPIGFVRLQVIRLVDEEALWLDQEVEPVATQALGDALRRLAGHQCGGVHPRVERRRSTVQPLAKFVEPVAESRSFRVGIEVEVAVLGGHVHGSVAAALTCHPVDVRRAAHHDEVGRLHEFDRGVVDSDDGGLELRSQTGCDVVGDHVGVAEHRLVHDQGADGGSLLLEGSHTMMRAGRGAMHGEFVPSQQPMAAILG